MPSLLYGDRWDSGAATWGAEDEDLELIYPVCYAADPDEALTFIATNVAPLAVTRPSGRTVVRQKLAVQPDDGGIYHVTASYGLRKPREPGEFDFTFSTTGGTAKRTQSFRTVNKYAAPGQTAPDFKGAIGVTSDGVEGCELQIGKLTWTETHDLPLAQCTFAYALTLKALTGKRNYQDFRGLPADSVIFRGADGGKQSEDTARLQFTFETDEHVTNLTLGPITGIAKKAWDYLWVRYMDEIDTTAKATTKRPLAAYVEEVTEAADFSLLGIGTTAPA